MLLQFLNLFGDAQSIKKAEDRHAKLFLPHRSTSELKKRHAEDFLASDKTKLAKSYSGVPSPVQSLMGTYPNTQNQWAAGYGAQPQAWPPASQVQGQQWAPGYTQQVDCLQLRSLIFLFSCILLPNIIKEKIRITGVIHICDKLVKFEKLIHNYGCWLLKYVIFLL